MPGGLVLQRAVFSFVLFCFSVLVAFFYNSSRVTSILMVCFEITHVFFRRGIKASLLMKSLVPGG